MEAIVSIYGDLILEGVKTIEQVPMKIRQLVEDYINDNS